MDLFTDVPIFWFIILSFKPKLSPRQSIAVHGFIFLFILKIVDIAWHRQNWQIPLGGGPVTTLRYWKYICMQRISHDRFLDIKIIVTRDAFQVLKLCKKSKKNAIVTLLWLPNCSRFIWAAISTNVTKNRSLKLFWVLRFIQIGSSVNWERVRYRNPVLPSTLHLRFRHLANQKRDILLST